MQSPNSCARDGFMNRFLPGTGKNLLHPGSNVNSLSLLQNSGSSISMKQQRADLPRE